MLGAGALETLRTYRYARVQRLLRENDCAALLLANPINVRYTTDFRNMTVWLLHNIGRYCLVPAEGRAVLFEYANRNCFDHVPPLPAIGEVRPVTAHSFFDAGDKAEATSHRWAAEIREIVHRWTGLTRQRLAVDRADLRGVDALRREGFQLVEGQRLMELARAVKSEEEITCMRAALRAADSGIQRMRDALRPGVSEIELWAELHHANIVLGGEWIETRLLSSGPRTNPWFQEASDRRIEAGDLVSFDTDMVGPYGYCADVSRTFLCGDGPARAEQRSLYALAVEQVEHNTALLAPGLSFRDYTARAWSIPARFEPQNYGCIAHGVGMVDEWPAIYCDLTDPLLQEGIFVPGMTVCVESYIGEVGGAEGVKLEQQVRVTEQGHEVLSNFPLEPKLV
ncbi:MAG TPA: Xaa-Pro peptidase family protein [Steroidobacteraceae bacterium]|nr:Xaa-Pro peptidase family protein [Steroidobacteraceae bacterium]